METAEAFVILDCSLARSASGRSCSNLRELLEAVRSAPDAVLEHHMLRCALDDHFELYEFPNDIARWCWDALGDRLLGEQMALIDPYQCGALPGVRAALVEAIEERLWSLDRVPWCRPGLELHLVESRLIAFDTGERVSDPALLSDAIAKLPVRSLFYHVHEARRRTGGRTDDFSMWLENRGADPTLVARVRAVDFYFLNLNQLRRELLVAFQPPPAGEPSALTREVA
ncbi:MAG: DUF5752 family protein [Planctomycetaceae bacterium]